MYPRAFNYHRAQSLQEACTMLSQLGPEAKLLAGGQSLIPLMKLRFANPAHLVDLNFVPDTSFIKQADGAICFGALTRHADIESSDIAAKIPILHDCAAGIADVQIRNRGTIGGSLAEADPSGDWAKVLMTLPATITCLRAEKIRKVALSDFIKDAYTTDLAHEEVISEVRVEVPPKGSGGCYLAFKRSAPVYPSASVAVQLSMVSEGCKDVSIFLGCVGLTPIRAAEAESALRGKELDEKAISTAADAVRSAGDPQPDMRGSAEYKRSLVAGLLKRAIGIAVRRARGEQAEAGHIYA
jgi:aerobic carbon-monoxide dehydrogenase medium subunit